MKSISKNVVFLRVGIDRGAGGMAAPLFKDGSFEFVPIDAAWHKHGLTYGNTLGIKKKKPLIQYFPASRQKKMHNRAIHNDPEFETFTYGDPTLPKQGLRRLERGDLLVLYCGLRGWNKCEAPEALYIVGFFNIQIAGTYSSLVKDRGADWVKKLFSRNHHIIHGDVNGNSYKRTN